ncbi:MAG: caspase family protein [Alphaproteobacteria bacterium]
MRNIVLGSALALAVGTVATSAFAEIDQRRVALVFGNQSYRYAGELSQTLHDADEMARTLQSVGFDVMLVQDADKREMQQALNQFRREIRGADVALVYYSGHGMEFDGENYLAPISARLGDRRTVDQEFLPLSDVMETVESGGAAFNMVLLDACRNNPFLDQMETTRSAVPPSPGLAPVMAPVGTLVAYATSPGTYAWEGGEDHDNSLFTEALMLHMTEPGVELAQTLRETRRTVMEWSDGEQVPWEHSAMIGEFFFMPAGEQLVAANEGTVIDAVEEAGVFTQSSLFGARDGQQTEPQTQARPSGVMTSVTPEAMQALLADLGLTSSIEASDDGVELVVDNTGFIPGDGVGIWFFDCDGQQCGSIQIWSLYESQRPLDLRQVNRWNTEQRWSIASVEEDRYAVLTLDVNLIGGVTAENIADLVQLFGSQSEEFRGYVL